MHELMKSEPEVKIIWRAFELRPEPVPTLDPKGDYLQRAWSTSVYPLAERLGIKMKLPAVQPRTRLAHRAAHWARTQERFDDYHAELFRAFFERGEDIGHIDVLVSLASAMKLDRELLRHALKTEEFEKSVLEDERTARDLGVGGVPAFIANRKAALSGVQPVEHLKKMIEQGRTASRIRE